MTPFIGAIMILDPLTAVHIRELGIDPYHLESENDKNRTNENFSVIQNVVIKPTEEGLYSLDLKMLAQTINNEIFTAAVLNPSRYAFRGFTRERCENESEILRNIRNYGIEYSPQFLKKGVSIQIGGYDIVERLFLAPGVERVNNQLLSPHTSYLLIYSADNLSYKYGDLRGYYVRCNTQLNRELLLSCKFNIDIELES